MSEVFDLQRNKRIKKAPAELNPENWSDVLAANWSERFRY